MQPEVGSIVEGKVTGITKFGAFVSLPDNKTGMIHISEISNQYVKDINYHIKLNQTVVVKILSIDTNNKISLSIKQNEVPVKSSVSKPEEFTAFVKNKGGNTFEDMLNKFKSDSDEKISILKKNQDLKKSPSSYSKKSGNKY
ncbi:MAG: S1 RNA-binding domain-containing protein [Eubacteriales bacterium]